MTQETESRSNARDHLANERTFLAWIRTSLGIMAFGFVMERFALVVKQLSSFVGKSSLSLSAPVSSSEQSTSSIFGIGLIVLGALICLLAFIKYKVGEKKIEEETYRPSFFLDAVVAVSVFSIGIFLIIYLIFIV
jgi:putative membrane protein